MGKSITSFDDWLGAEDPDGHEEIYALYQAVSNRETFGNYEVKVKDERTFIKGSSDSTLVLGSEKARDAFLREVEKLKDDDEMDMEGWYAYSRAMANPHA